jgi:acetyl/propionyl-CoA carboxylase alpha subunit
VEGRTLKTKFKANSDVHEFEAVRSGDKLTISFDGVTSEVLIQARANQRFTINRDGKNLKGCAVRIKDQIFIHFLGRHFNFEDITNQEDDIAGGHGMIENIITPMPGSVIKIYVVEGQAVTTGQPIVIVEAMKMENEVKASADAVVSKVNVVEGQQVDSGQVLIEFAKPVEDEEASAS